MAARFQIGAPTPKHEQAMTQAELGRLRTQERQFHRLCYRQGANLALCNCGYLLRDVTKNTVTVRHEMHVHAVMEAWEERYASNAI